MEAIDISYSGFGSRTLSMSSPNGSLKPKLTISNSFCTMRGFSPQVISAITKLLTYHNQEVSYEIRSVRRLLERVKNGPNTRMVYALRGKIKDLSKREVVCLLKDNKFPTGLLSMVLATLEEIRCIYEIEDTRVVPDYENILRWYNKPHTPRYYQQDMIEIARDHCRGVFESACGSGKTNIMTYIIKEKAVNTLILVPSRALLEQTFRFLKSAFGKNNIEIVTGDKIRKQKQLKCPIRITTVQTLAALAKDKLLEPILNDIDMLMVDEVHHVGAKSYGDLLPYFDHIYYRYGFTGTFLRNDSKTLEMFGFLSDILYQYLPKQATKEGFLSPVKFIIQNVQGTSVDDYAGEYKENYCGRPEILNTIHRRIQQIPKDEQILILVDRKETSGAVIHKHLRMQGVDATYISGDNTKKEITDSIEAFNDKEIRVLIGSTVIGEGVDINSTQHLILATGGKSIIKIVQAVGRCVRLHPDKTQSYVYDFNFVDTNYLEKHCQQRVEIYKTQFSGDIEWI